MITRYKQLGLVILFISLINPFSFLCAQNSGITEKGIKDIARVESVNFLNDIPVGQEVLYGFDNRGQFKSVTVGRPIQIVSLSAESCPGGNINADLKIVPNEE